MRCPRCGKENPPGARFCAYCGSTPDAGGPAPPAARAGASRLPLAIAVLAILLVGGGTAFMATRGNLGPQSLGGRRGPAANTSGGEVLQPGLAPGHPSTLPPLPSAAEAAAGANATDGRQVSPLTGARPGQVPPAGNAVAANMPGGLRGAPSITAGTAGNVPGGPNVAAGQAGRLQGAPSVMAGQPGNVPRGPKVTAGNPGNVTGPSVTAGNPGNVTGPSVTAGEPGNIPGGPKITAGQPGNIPSGPGVTAGRPGNVPGGPGVTAGQPRGTPGPGVTATQPRQPLRRPPEPRQPQTQPFPSMIDAYLTALKMVLDRDRQLEMQSGAVVGQLMASAMGMQGAAETSNPRAMFNQQRTTLNGFQQLAIAQRAIGNEFLRSCEPLARRCPPNTVQPVHMAYRQYFGDCIQSSDLFAAAVTQLNIGNVMQAATMMEQAKRTKTLTDDMLEQLYDDIYRVYGIRPLARWPR